MQWPQSDEVIAPYLKSLLTHTVQNLKGLYFHSTFLSFLIPYPGFLYSWRWIYTEELDPTIQREGEGRGR
jgi:hypothetical protein